MARCPSPRVDRRSGIDASAYGVNADELETLLWAAARSAKDSTDGKRHRGRLAAALYDRSASFFARRSGAGADLDDLRQELLIKVMREVDKSPDWKSPVAWVHTVARNLLTDHWRRRARVADHYAHGEDADNAYQNAVDREESNQPDSVTHGRAMVEALAAYAERAGYPCYRHRRHQVLAWTRLAICGEGAADVARDLNERGEVSGATEEAVWKWAQRVPRLLAAIADDDEDPGRAELMRALVRSAKGKGTSWTCATSASA